MVKTLKRIQRRTTVLWKGSGVARLIILCLFLVAMWVPTWLTFQTFGDTWPSVVVAWVLGIGLPLLLTWATTHDELLDG